MKKIILNLVILASVTLVSCNNTNTQQNAETITPTTEQSAVTEGSQAETFAYSVNPTSVVEWVGSKPAGIHNGTVNVTKGGVNVENGAITKAEFVLDMNTITVLDLQAGKGKEDLEAHLEGTDPEKVFTLNERKEFTVLDIDKENRKISLSLGKSSKKK